MRHIAQPGTGLDYDPRPIRILAHAFGKGAPLRDLRLSPDHAVFVDGALVPIRYLLNGTTIAREAVAEVTYYHIQLENSAGAPSHEIVYAEGLPVESYLNTGNRSALDDAGIVEQGVASGMSKGRTRVS